MPKKRRRNPGFSKTQIRKSDEESQTSGTCINDLPSTILFDIVLKLPVKSIVMCKCVCKSWRSLISDPNFAELHFAQSKPCTLVRDTNNSRISRSLYLMESEDFCRDSGFCRCRPHKRCKHGRFNAKVKARLKIPISNVRVMLEKVGNSFDSRAVFYVDFKGNSRNLVKLESCYSHRYDVVNSCNGLLCLSRNSQRDSKIVVCNPVTGEFIHLPENSSDHLNKDVFSVFIGFGYSPKHSQYKVVRIFTLSQINQNGGRSFLKVSQIHTVGTDSWRSLDASAVELGPLMSPAYLDGTLYSFFLGRSKNYKVASFDLDEELFQVHTVPPGPPRPRFYGGTPFISLRAIGGRIFLYTEFAFTRVDIWVMDGNGISKSWPKLFSVDISELHGSQEPHWYKLISCLNNEAVVLLGGPRSEIIYYNQSEGLRFKQLKFQGFVSMFEAISHTPSFIPLKDIVKHSDVEVLNINTGCGKLKLSEETYPLLLRGARN